MEKIFDFLLWEEENKEEQEHKIYKVPMSTLTWYINRWTTNCLPDERRKLLYSYDIECGKWVGIDNITNDCFMKDFTNEIDCLRWLGADV